IEGITPLRKEQPCAWLSIMYGCNNYCSYCIVPYVRGRERSRDPKLILSELDTLVSEGYKDITLLVQNVNSYGNDTGDIDFSELLKRADSIEGDFRLRFMTSHPKDASRKLFDVMANSRHICRSVHLPVQSGSDRILKLMNRKYDAEKYCELIDYARSVMPDITITSDVIVGFPGETEDDYNKTIELLNKVRFDSLFTFIYSKRPGTKAALMEDATTPQEKQIRFDKLLEVQNQISRSINETYLNRKVRVLIDGKSEDPNYDFKGRTNGFKLVHIKNDRLKTGDFADVTIDRVSTWALFGR
ncbi:MAG: MiaB/RimO family radical SAM methylthiotransferase, partial [Clostridia bacterium]|nr:MiaB/RimO family radical SAM methylthiotransferase [Clostridia bacterium]